MKKILLGSIAVGSLLFGGFAYAQAPPPAAGGQIGAGGAAGCRPNQTGPGCPAVQGGAKGGAEGAAQGAPGGAKGKTDGVQGAQGPQGGAQAPQVGAKGDAQAGAKGDAPGAVAAAPQGAGATPSKGGGRVTITAQQQTNVRQVMLTEKSTPVTNVTFAISLGVSVPSTIVLRPVPLRIVEYVPEYQNYLFFVLADGRIVIVEPGSMMIVLILTA
jgi:hypothetical protein